MEPKKRIALIVTGSIAAIKTLPLIAALRARDHDVTTILTRAPEEWKWVSVEKATAACGHPVLTDRVSAEEKRAVLSSSDNILVAPASADFISQLAYGESGLAQAVVDSWRKGARLMVAPAMNYKMWEHPASLRNCETLYGAGAVILGPAQGCLACGDQGYGRMMDIKDMVAAIVEALAVPAGNADTCYLAARREKSCALFTPPKNARPLIALTGEYSLPLLAECADSLARKGQPADYIADAPWATHLQEVEAVTHSPIVTKHFQIPELKGMEHIKLPEEASRVVFPFITNGVAERMLQGRTDSFCLNVYLASKAPVVTTSRCMQNLSPLLAERLRGDGMVVDDNWVRS